MQRASVKLLCVSMVTILFAGMVLVNSVSAAAKPIVLAKYPNLKIGFTTVNFMKVLPVSLDNLKKIVDFASEQGFAWIEVRDPNASLKLEECQQLAPYAQAKKIEVAYAINVGFMDYAFKATFPLGLANAAAFTEGPKTLRMPAAGKEFTDVPPKKQAWTADEFARIVDAANQAGAEAAAKGVKLAVENAFEPFKGDGRATFGTSEFFAKVANVFWEFDTANFFAV